MSSACKPPATFFTDNGPSQMYCCSVTCGQLRSGPRLKILSVANAVMAQFSHEVCQQRAHTERKLNSIIEIRPLDDYNGNLNAPTRMLTERKQEKVL